MPSQSGTDQKLVPLLPLRKNLDGSQGMHAVSICTLCTNSKLKPCVEEQNSQLHQKEAILKRQRRNKRALQLPKRSVNVLIFQRKLLVLEFVKQNPNLGSRKLADQFEIRKTQIQATLKNKEAIIDNYASNETPKRAQKKNVHSSTQM